MEELKRRVESKADQANAQDEGAFRANIKNEVVQAAVEFREIPSNGKVETSKSVDGISLDMSSILKVNTEAIDVIASTPLTAQQENAQNNSTNSSAGGNIKSKLNPPVQPEQSKTVTEVSDISPNLKQEVVPHGLASHEDLQKLAAEQAAIWAKAELRAAQQSRLEAERAAMQAKVAQKPSRARRGVRQTLGKLFAVLAGLVLVLVVSLPSLWPLSGFIPPIEQHLSARVGQPVQIGGLKASLLPLPELKIHQLALGPNRELTASEVALRFDLSTLFAADKVINEAELKGVEVAGAQLEQLMTWLQGLNGNAVFSLRKLTLKDLQIKAEGIVLPQFNGSASFENGEFTRLVLQDAGNKMHIDLQSTSGPLQIKFGIRESSLPLLPQVQFSEFNAKGEIAGGKLVLSELDAVAYNGVLLGSGSMSWHNGWQITAQVNAKTMELDSMFPQYGLSGELFAEGVISSSSTSLAGLADALHLEGKFEARRGVINGVDMVETAHLLSRQHLAGGRTHFDQLNGSIWLDGHNLRLAEMTISSGILKAVGSVEIAGEGRLAGNFDAQLKVRGGNTPLVLSGTLEKPELRAR